MTKVKAAERSQVRKVDPRSHSIEVELATHQKWVSQIDRRFVPDVLDPDVFEHEVSLLNHREAPDEVHDCALEDAVQAHGTADPGISTDAHECDCSGDEVCIKCCTALDLASLPREARLKARPVNHRPKVMGNRVGEVFDLFLPRFIAEMLALVDGAPSFA
ncbi:MAG TPA: hypothetical protein VFT82_02420 [Candidatus Paceibacterota bacterium]|nr:hypothetical protein [Candidatus Paceibacterota bacterium]